jgi:glycerate 2-kinase
LRLEAEALFRAAIDAVDPRRLVASHLKRDRNQVVIRNPVTGAVLARWRLPLLVIGSGKAAARMAAGCEEVLGAGALHGSVIVPDGGTLPSSSISMAEAGHPLPDARGEAATRDLLLRLDGASDEGVLCLISGGTSSLLVSPRPPVQLADKIETTKLLLACGASIGEISVVRKHLSLVKGGGLLRRMRGEVVNLILSDVPGDDPSIIGSGPTVPDPSSFADAAAVFERYELAGRLPRTVLDIVRRGIAGAEPETLKPGDQSARRVSTRLIATNRTALEGAAVLARQRGWRVEIDPRPLEGDTTDAARRFAASLRRPGTSRRCVLAGGETTVRVSGPGRGGRNQEFALALVDVLEGTDIVVLSAGTDGVDGPTPAAGAFVDGTTMGRARQRGSDPARALAQNDSYTFFSQLGDLFVCGPTGTNVMDIKIAFVP